MNEKSYLKRSYENYNETRLVTICLIIIILAGTFVYSNTLQSNFYLDDDVFIIEDENIRMSKFSREALGKALLEGSPPHRLLPNLSFALNYYFGQYNVVGYHIFNIIIHLLTAITLFFLLLTTCKISFPPSPLSPHLIFIPFSAVLIWMLHPVNTQSVTYICQRMTSLAALFYILSLLSYVKGRIFIRTDRKIKITGIAFFVGCAVAGSCAVASKENAATLLLIIAFYEWIFFQNLKIRWSQKKLFLLAGMMILFTAIAVLYLGENPFQRIMNGYRYRDFSMPQRLMTELRVVVYYISLFFFPHPKRLNLEHDFPLSYWPVFPWTTVLCLIAIIGFFCFAILIARKDKLVLFCILWFFVNLIIESSIIGLEIIFEHRTYLPFMLTGLLLVLLMRKLLKSKRLLISVICGVSIIFSVWTYQRNSVWQNEVRFYTDCVNKSPKKFRPNNNLGIALYNKEDFENAIKQYRIAVDINPLHKNIEYTLNNLGNAAQKLNRFDEAIYYFNRALQINPIFTKAHINLGSALIATQRYDQALKQFHMVLDSFPDSIETHINMGVALSHLNRLDEAIDHYLKAIELNPYQAEAHNNLGVLFIRQNRTKKAMYHFKMALQINPHYANAKNNLTKLRQLQTQK